MPDERTFELKYCSDVRAVVDFRKIPILKFEFVTNLVPLYHPKTKNRRDGVVGTPVSYSSRTGSLWFSSGRDRVLPQPLPLIIL